MSEATVIRPLEARDEAAWRTLWRQYLAFYKTIRNEEVYATYFTRLLGDEPQDFHALVAERNGTLVGLTHFLFHRHGWRIGNVCYLQDLYATPETRGTGVGRALIEAVYDAADKAGIEAVYWLTQEGNSEARKLYDRIAVKSDFIKYDRPAS